MKWFGPVWSVASVLSLGCQFASRAAGAGDDGGSDSSGGSVGEVAGPTDGVGDGVDDGSETPTATGGTDDSATNGSATGDPDDDPNDDDSDTNTDTEDPPRQDCGGPLPDGWIVCEDFEDFETPLQHFALFESAEGRMAVEEGVSLSGTSALRIRHDANPADWSGWMTIRFGAGPAAPGATFAEDEVFEDLWVRINVRTEVDWPDSGHMDLFELQALRSDDGALIAQAQAWSPPFGTTLVTRAMSCYNPANPGMFTCNGTNNDFNTDYDLDEVQGDIPLFGEAYAEQWSCIELHMRLNDVGESNGAIEAFVNGQSQGAMTDLDLRYDEAGASINRLRMATFWASSGAVALDRWVDDIVVATVRPHCNE